MKKVEKADLNCCSTAVLVTLPLSYLKMIPKCKSSNSDMPKKSCQVLPLSGKLCMYKEKNSIYKVQDYLWFQASTAGLFMSLLG